MRYGSDVNADAVAEPRSHRDLSLDGLRGIAALVVLVHHSLLVIPALAEPHATGGHQTNGFGWAWWLTNTPLHTLWNGGEAVYVFFLLSGFVLMPRTVRVVAAWRSYYASRLLRLYIPVFVATMLTLLMVFTVPRHSEPHASWWLNAHAFAVSPTSVMRDAYLVRGTDWFNSAFWSLQWEVIFSIMLPVYVVFSRFARRLWVIKALALFVLIGLSAQFGHMGLTYLSMFALGSLLAVERDKVMALVQRVSNRRPRIFWASILVGTVLALNASWLTSTQFAANPRLGAAMVPIDVAGALLVMLIVLSWPAARTSLARPTPQWLGSRSFSLYLVHEPLVVSIALLLGPRLAPLTLVVAVPVALLVTDLFYRLIERPSHRLSKFIGARVAPSGLPATVTDSISAPWVAR